MAQRLVIALALIVALSVACWLILPRYGFDVPIWLPFAGYFIILLACVLPMLEREQAEVDELHTIDPGPSPDDIARFGGEDESRR